MRYMWGHGVGHKYCHPDAPAVVVLDSLEVESGTDPDEPNLDAEREAAEYQDTLDDLEAEELDVRGDSEEEVFEEDGDIQDPDDESTGDERW